MLLLPRLAAQFVKGVRHYSVVIRYAYIGKPDVADKMVAKVGKILPPAAAKAKAKMLSGDVEAAATNCAYGLCSLVINTSNGLDVLEGVSAQLTPFDVPVGESVHRQHAWQQLQRQLASCKH